MAMVYMSLRVYGYDIHVFLTEISFNQRFSD